mmetsp:Transcript_6370/g.14142  ORF Transcript_6370/g.14142 Transcript_6370/m.14142 type:complete len:229 (+) Transcript_6370:698-1384(+)
MSLKQTFRRVQPSRIGQVIVQYETNAVPTTVVVCLTEHSLTEVGGILVRQELSIHTSPSDIQARIQLEGIPKHQDRDWTANTRRGSFRRLVVVALLRLRLCRIVHFPRRRHRHGLCSSLYQQHHPTSTPVLPRPHSPTITGFPPHLPLSRTHSKLPSIVPLSNPFSPLSISSQPVHFVDLAYTPEVQRVGYDSIQRVRYFGRGNGGTIPADVHGTIDVYEPQVPCEMA